MAADCPPVATPISFTETRTVRAVQFAISPFEDRQVSRAKTWFGRLPPSTRFVALEENTTNRPSPLTAWALDSLGPLAALPSAATEIVTVEAVQLVTGASSDTQASRIKTLSVPNP